MTSRKMKRIVWIVAISLNATVAIGTCIALLLSSVTDDPMIIATVTGPVGLLCGLISGAWLLATLNDSSYD